MSDDSSSLMSRCCTLTYFDIVDICSTFPPSTVDKYQIVVYYLRRYKFKSPEYVLK